MRRRRGGDLRRGLLYDPRVGGMGNTARGAGSFISDHPKFERGGAPILAAAGWGKIFRNSRHVRLAPMRRIAIIAKSLLWPHPDSYIVRELPGSGSNTQLLKFFEG